MQFLHRKNPAIYFQETSKYVDDLQRITLLRDKCTNEKEKAEYDNIIFVMQRVLAFMNSIHEKDQQRLIIQAQ